MRLEHLVSADQVLEPVVAVPRGSGARDAAGRGPEPEVFGTHQELPGRHVHT
jgi:hypothetical protein